LWSRLNGLRISTCIAQSVEHLTSDTGVPEFDFTVQPQIFSCLPFQFSLLDIFLVFIVDRNRNFTGYFWPWSLDRNTNNLFISSLSGFKFPHKSMGVTCGMGNTAKPANKLILYTIKKTLFSIFIFIHTFRQQLEQLQNNWEVFLNTTYIYFYISYYLDRFFTWKWVFHIYI
jgi:hypothetical protein